MGVAVGPQLGQAVEPAGGAADHGHVLAEGLAAVVEGSRRRGELDRHVGAAERLAVQLVAVVDVDAGHYLVAAQQRLPLYLMAHAAISYQCYLHFVS